MVKQGMHSTCQQFRTAGRSAPEQLICMSCLALPSLCHPPLLPTPARRCLERVISRRVQQLALPLDPSEPSAEEVERVQVCSVFFYRLTLYPGVLHECIGWMHMAVLVTIQPACGAKCVGHNLL